MSFTEKDKKRLVELQTLNSMCDRLNLSQEDLLELEALKKKRNANFDEVERPKHYNNHPSGVESIDINEYLDYCLGCVWKYTMRFRDKGTPLKDLKKGLWYAQRSQAQGHSRILQVSESMDIEYKVESYVKSVVIAEPDTRAKDIFNSIYVISRKHPEAEVYCREKYAILTGGISELIQEWENKNGKEN